jgi:hypothetical protein
MTDPPEYRDSTARPARRWLRVVGIVAAIVLLLLIVVRLLGGGAQHGPARHIGVTPSLTMEV